MRAIVLNSIFILLKIAIRLLLLSKHFINNRIYKTSYRMEFFTQ